MARNSTSAGFDSMRYPSWCLSQMLDNIIGTDATVTFRRRCSSVFDYVVNVGRYFEYLSSGSRAEGFCLVSSDVDIMFIDRRTIVTDPSDNTEVTGDHKTVLMMRRIGCHPGFVILQLRNRTNDRYITKSLVDYQGSPVVSSLLFRDAHLLERFGQVGHGPCNTFNYDGDVDVAQCFKCKKWPSEASEFIHRSRPYEWPQKSLLDKIIRRGCLVVPIGDKDNDLSYIQWRLSFSAAEKDLIHSFTHSQFRVYGLLKIFLKQVISQIKSVEDLLCSYFLKTVLFFSIENTPASFWRDDLLIPCFWFCLNRLMKHIGEGYLPNYFVPQNNMFRHKVNGTNQRNLLLVCNQLKRIGWSCIYLCKDFRSLQTFVRYPESILGSRFISSNSQQEVILDTLLLNSISDCFINMDAQRMNDSLSRSLTLVRYARSQREVDLSMLILYRVLGSIGQVYFCKGFNLNNTCRYNLLRKCERFLLASVKTDISSGRLTLATFYYQTEQYNKAIQECHCIMAQWERWKPYVLYFSRQQHVCFWYDSYRQYICDRELPGLVKAKALWALGLLVPPDFKTFYPSDLWYDIKACEPFYLYIPPIPYAAFLLFLCHHKLRNIDHSVAAIHDLKILADDEVQGYRRNPIVLNFLAICLNKAGDKPGATDACLLSLRIKPERNGANKLLDNILLKNC